MAHSRTTRQISLLGTVALMTFHAAGALAQSAAPGSVIVLDPVVIQGDATAAHAAAASRNGRCGIRQRSAKGRGKGRS